MIPELTPAELGALTLIAQDAERSPDKYAMTNCPHCGLVFRVCDFTPGQGWNILRTMLDAHLAGTPPCLAAHAATNTP